MLVALFAVHLPNGFSFMNITGMIEAGPQFGTTWKGDFNALHEDGITS
jgi:hypothetical protein